MENSKEFSVSGLINGILKVNKKIAENYLKNSSAYHHDNRDIALSYFNFFSKIVVNPHELAKVQNVYWDLFKNQQKVWENVFMNSSSKNNVPFIEPQEGDKRFLAPEWTNILYFNFIKQNYLLIEKSAERIIDEVDMDDKEKKRLEFYNDQYVDLFSPANSLATNPEALKLAFESKGKSLWQGFTNFVQDIEKGKISQSDESAFEVGKNLAMTPGSVIYENELIQLIQYAPATKQVHEIPMLIIPPWINKYYILDIEPQRSFVKFLTEKGITAYIISWRNPSPGMGHLTFDDYVQEGVLRAIKVVKEISEVKKINTLGYCLGGTLLSVAASILSLNKQSNPINSATFLASMVDFSDIGPMGAVVTKALVKKIERGELLKDGIMHGHDMERAFNLIRVNDLVWHYAVNNYLKGIKPTAFNVLYWTNDNTNLPAEMYKYYMRKMVLENKLSRKNALTICNSPIDIGKIEFPVFVIGLNEDYISPAHTVFTTTKLVNGPVEFILGGSGHVMGATNPPSKNKYGYYLDGKLGGSFENWKKTAKFFEGSWWTPWSERLLENSGKQIPAQKKQGNEKYEIIEPAPGKYVMEKCSDSIKKNVEISLGKNKNHIYQKENKLIFEKNLNHTN
ncbi:MAG: alpha/beta fold hydrolase [Bacteroidia bacterium]